MPVGPNRCFFSLNSLDLPCDTFLALKIGDNLLDSSSFTTTETKYSMVLKASGKHLVPQ